MKSITSFCLLVAAAFLFVSCGSTFELKPNQWRTVLIGKDNCTSWPCYDDDGNIIKGERCISDITYLLTRKEGRVILTEQSIDVSRGIYHIRNYEDLTPAETEKIVQMMGKLMAEEGHEQEKKLVVSGQGMSHLYEMMQAQEGVVPFEAESDKIDAPLFEKMVETVRDVAKAHGDVLPLTEVEPK